MKLKLLITKLRRGIFSSESLKDGDDVETPVPNDVKEGYFAVVAVKGGEPKRFVVELGYLSNPAFLSLLEQAEEEYGFQQKGVLEVPCPPEELQKVLKYKKTRRISAEW
ncbi:Auxin-responsive protein [Melia azedarach]|uniref:Auxin-responsive protein n=1 Tax=Melia azedarach TaxID=155640 RepID=A0ACC1X0Y8_MELAZ|nr:Auxin-responsive protein [Melia azedarach]